MKLFTWLTASVSLLSRIHSKTVDESLTGALLTFPDASDGPLFNKTFEVAPAQFGYQAYGGTMKGQLVLPANETFHKECPRCSSGQSTLCDSVGTEPTGLNPYIHYIQDWFIEEDDITDYILVIDRQDCYFVNKIEFAQQLGASGVIICDYQPEHLFTMWMPQDWNDDIDIPAVLLSYDDCRVLMAHLGVTNWSPTLSSSQVAQMGYPTPESMNWTVATIEWGLPHPDDMVEYDLWTSSNDYLGSKFKHNFNETAIRLDLANDTIFTPHMYILNGSHWMCDEVDDAGNPTLPCGKQCTNSGRYCAVDPEYDITIGLDGSDVIQENLRSLCVWEFDKEFGKNKLDDIMWWDYAVLWDENCGVYANSSMNFHATCSYQQMDALKPDGSLSAYVQQCIVDSGGYGDTDGLNTILKRETRLKYNQSIYAVPLVAVNGFLIHGNIDCEPPVTAATCEVLAAICAGFVDGTQPDVCYVTPAPTVANCTQADRDCAGTCFGSYQMDACDQCLPISSHDWNKCIGCNGNTNGTQFDCEGTCGGHYAVNPCGYCKDTRHAEFETFGIDCNGGCEIDVQLDECGECLKLSDEKRNACFGCDGVKDSGKELNACGMCELATDPNFDTYGRDCTGNCTSSYVDTRYEDKCGQCLLPNDPAWDDCPEATTAEEVMIEHKEDELVTVIVVVVIIGVMVVAAACLIIYFLYKKQKVINQRFDSLAATYVHMDDNPKHSVPVQSAPRQASKPSTLTSVPDQEEDDEQ